MMVLLLAFLLAGPNEGSPKQAAQVHWNRGQRLYEAGRYAEALEEFKAGYENDPLPAFLINIGQIYRKMGERRKAITAYQQYLDLQPPGDRLRTQIESIVRKLEQEDRAGRAEPPDSSAPPTPVEVAPAPPPPAPPKSPPPKPAKPAVDLAARPPAPDPAQEAVDARRAPSGERDNDVAWYGHWWVWAAVGAAIVGGISVASAGGGTNAPTGSLGTIDGRR